MDARQSGVPTSSVDTDSSGLSRADVERALARFAEAAASNPTVRSNECNQHIQGDSMSNDSAPCWCLSSVLRISCPCGCTPVSSRNRLVLSWLKPRIVSRCSKLCDLSNSKTSHAKRCP